MNDDRKIESEDRELSKEELAKIRFGSIIGSFFDLIKPEEKAQDAEQR